VPPPPPSLLGASATTAAAPIFSTDETITLTRATLTTLYSVDPDSDTYADHSASQTAGFAFFDAMQPVPHQLYLGHDAMFRLPSSAEIQLSFDLAAVYALSTPRPLLLDWEYLSTDGWLPLRTGSDTTARLTLDGQVVLWLDHGPDAQQSTIAGISSYWIRATVSSRIPSGLIGPLPGGYPLTWSASPTIKVGDVVAIGENNTDPTKQAKIVAFALSTVTMDRSLPGAMAGLPVYIFNSTQFVGSIVQAAGQTLVLAGVDPGRTIKVAGVGSATVLDGAGNVAMLDQFPAGVDPKTAPGATLSDATTGEPVGTLVSIGADFFVPLDSGA
jgi:hypothetical protein